MAFIRGVLWPFLLFCGVVLVTACGGSTEELNKAIVERDLARVRELAGSIKDINARDKNGESPLYKALGSGDVEYVRAIVDAGADVRLTNQFGMPVLDVAVLYDMTGDVTEYLLGEGAEIVQTAQWSPLRGAAASSGSSRPLELLIAHGGDPNYGIGKIPTPIYLAVVSDKVDRVRLLLELGADPWADVNGFMPIHQASSAEMRNFLLQEMEKTKGDRTLPDPSQVPASGRLDAMEMMMP